MPRDAPGGAGPPGPPAWDGRSHLPKALKALRRRRGARVGDMASALGMARRTYESFEAGDVRLTLEGVRRAAVALNADPFGLLAAVLLGSPELALRSADNGLVAALMLALMRFDARAGDKIDQLDWALVSETFERAFRELETAAAARSPHWGAAGPGGRRAGP